MAASSPQAAPAGAASEPHPATEELRKLLMNALRESRPEDARRLAEELLAANPADTITLAIAAEGSFGKDGSAEHVRYQAPLVALQRDDAGGRLALARSMLKLGAWRACYDICDRLIAASPGTLSLWRLQLEALIAGDDNALLLAWCRKLPASRAGANVNFAAEVIRALNKAVRANIDAQVIGDIIVSLGAPPPLLREVALQAYRDKNWDLAQSYWSNYEAVVEPQRLREARVHLARIAYNRGDRARAARIYETIVEIEHGDDEAARYLVRHYIRENQTGRAGEILSQYEAVAGFTTATAWLKALLLQARGDAAGAKNEFVQACQKWPESIELYIQFSDMLASGGDTLAALEPLETAAAINPSEANVLSRQYRLKAALGAPAEELLDLTERFLRVKPDDVTNLRQKANLLIRMGQRRKAVEALRAAIAVSPRQAAIWQSLAANLLILNENDEVAALVEDVKSLFAAQTVADLTVVGEVLEAADRLDEAAGYAEQAAALDGTAGAPRLLLARVLDARGRYREAWAVLCEANEMAPGLGKQVNMFARIAKCLSYVDERPSNRESDRFPDAVLNRMSLEAEPRRIAESEPVVFEVTSSLGAGGAERQVAMTMLGLKTHGDHGLTPVLVARDLNPAIGRDFFLPLLEGSGCEVAAMSEVRSQGRVRDLAARRPEFKPQLALLAALPAAMSDVALPLFELIVARRPRIVHVWQDSIAVAGGVAAMLAGVPRIVLGTRSTRPVERQRARAWIKGGYHALLRYPGTVMVNNSLNGAADYTEWLGIEPGVIRTIYNGFDFAAMDARRDPPLSQSLRARAGAGAGDVVIGGVMRLSYEKRPELWLRTVIDLCRRSAKVRGILVGEGPMMNELQRSVAEAGLANRIVLAGRQAPIEPWMAAMDVLFLSSLTEGLPNVLIEAQSLGLAVASMRVGGAPETVAEGKTAILIDEAQRDFAAGAILPLVQNAAMRRGFGAAGIDWTRANFSNEAMIGRLLEIYRVR